MKTKQNRLGIRITSAAVIAVIALLVSCQTAPDILNANDTQNVNAESASASFSNEATDIASSAIGGITPTQYSGGRVSGGIIGLGLFDDRLAGATITLISTGTKEAPKGEIKIEYGNGVTDTHGVTRKGTIVIDYSGKRLTPNSVMITRLVNFFRNDAHIEGVITLTTQVSADSLHLQFNSVLDSGKITFGDGRYVTRTHNITREWIRSIASASNNQWITLVGGVAAGVTKGGKNYTMQITKSLLEKVACRAEKVFIPVQGTKVVTVGNNEYTIDYGTGNCDNVVSVTLNGKIKQITVSADGN